MKRWLTLVCVVLATGCGNDKPANPLQGAEQNAPQPVAVQEREIAGRLEQQKRELDEKQRKVTALAERMKTVAPLQDIIDRWLTVRVELSRPDMQLTTQELITRMQALKKEAESAAVDDCSIKARNSMVESMTQTLAITAKVLANKGKTDPSIQQEVNQAYQLQQRAEGELSECTVL